MFKIFTTILIVFAPIFFNGCKTNNYDNNLKDGVYLAAFVTFNYIDGDVENLPPDERHLEIKSKIDLPPNVVKNMLGQPRQITESPEDFMDLVYKSGKTLLSISMGIDDYDILVRKVVISDNNKAFWPGGEYIDQNIILTTVSKEFFIEVYQCLLKSKKTFWVNSYIKHLRAFYPELKKLDCRSRPVQKLKSKFYTDDDNMKKYVHLKNKADMYIYFHSMDNIEVIDVQQNTSKCDIKSLDEYINKYVKNKNIVYMTYSKWARVKYLGDAKKNMQTIIFWKNYFAKFGFKRLIIQMASSKKGFFILVDKNIPVMSNKQDLQRQ